MPDVVPTGPSATVGDAVVVELVRRIDLAPSIVWSALVDPELVAGWLHPRLRLVTGADVQRRVEQRTLELQHPDFGELGIRLHRIPGELRDTGTRLVLVVQPPSGCTAEVAAATWRTRLDQLEELLRGRPVDWRRWRVEPGVGSEATAAAMRPT